MMASPSVPTSALGPLPFPRVAAPSPITPAGDASLEGRKRERGEMDEVEEPAAVLAKDMYGDLFVEDDLYGDLFVEDEKSAPPVTTISIEALKEKIETLNKEKKQALQQVAELKEKNVKLQEERTVLVNNLSSIFKTAQLEIKRKDMFIKDLREENQRLKE